MDPWCGIIDCDMPKAKQNSLRVGPQGRVVIPAQFREALDIDAGDTLMVRADKGRLVLEKPEQVLARLKSTFDEVPPEVSLVDELIAERREEARKENEA